MFTPVVIGTTVATVVGLVVLFGIVKFILNLRRVVPANEVHIVQTTTKQTSYGADKEGGNTYYAWPSFLPKLGMTAVVLPVSVFDVNLHAYEAYDKERVPFVVDITAFFRINHSDVAAQRVSSFQELKDQLQSVVQGAVRTILANHDIDTIMIERSKFGEQFTKEVADQLKNWGVEPVKNIELMDIRDSKTSNVIANIMAKRTSAIERDSRIEVAANHREAENAEIAAKREVELNRQQAEQAVGQRTAEREREVGKANEQAKQVVLEEAKATTVREMDVKQVEQTRSAEIAKEVAVVKANEVKDVSIVNAEGQKARDIIDAEALRQKSVIEAEGKKQQTTLVAEGDLAAQKLSAEGIQAEGTARAEAERAMLMAPVTTQIELAREIGNNLGYQQYLITVKQIDANRDIGIQQAEALKQADVKVISNTGTPTEGLTNVMDLFTSKGGQALGSALEGFVNTPTGERITKKLLGDEKASAVATEADNKPGVTPVAEVVKTLQAAAGQSTVTARAIDPLPAGPAKTFEQIALEAAEAEALADAAAINAALAQKTPKRSTRQK